MSQYDKIGEIETNLKETRALLQNDVNRIIERGERLDTISERSENLNTTSRTFRTHTGIVRRRLWLKNRWLSISIILIVFLIIVLTILLIVQPWKKH